MRAGTGGNTGGRQSLKRSAAAILAVGLLLGAIGLPGIAHAAGTGQNGYTASDYATGLYYPAGVAFDALGNLYLATSGDHLLYEIPAGGGTPQLKGSTQAFGLAFTHDGKLYATTNGSSVIEIDPNTGTTIRTVATTGGGSLGIAVDPLSGDLFIGLCGPGVCRVSNFASGPGTLTNYASISYGTDGVAFGADGTLYAATFGGQVAKVAGTNTANPGQVLNYTAVPVADGVGVAATDTFIAVNRNDGVISKVDYTSTPTPMVTNIVTGGTRGDFMTVGPDGCLYATQTSSIEKVTNADGTCSFAPVAPGGTGTGTGTATPELGSGELFATGILPIGAVLLFRRRRARRTRRDDVA